MFINGKTSQQKNILVSRSDGNLKDHETQAYIKTKDSRNKKIFCKLSLSLTNTTLNNAKANVPVQTGRTIGNKKNVMISQNADIRSSINNIHFLDSKIDKISNHHTINQKAGDIISPYSSFLNLF